MPWLIEALVAFVEPQPSEVPLELRLVGADWSRAGRALDRPWFVQYSDWVGGVLVGDFGQSLRLSLPVAEVVGEIQARQGPEDVLRQSLLQGNADALIPLFESEDFKRLDPGKQELLRANRLAANSTQGPLKMVHILHPESPEETEIWELSAGLPLFLAFLFHEGRRACRPGGRGRQ